jgi:hypothetical protein
MPEVEILSVRKIGDDQLQVHGLVQGRGYRILVAKAGVDVLQSAAQKRRLLAQALCERWEQENAEFPDLPGKVVI